MRWDQPKSVSGASQDFAGEGPGHCAFCDDGSSVHKHVVHSLRELVRLLEGGEVANRCGIEDDDVGPHALFALLLLEQPCEGSAPRLQRTACPALKATGQRRVTRLSDDDDQSNVSNRYCSESVQPYASFPSPSTAPVCTVSLCALIQKRPARQDEQAI